MRERQPAMLDTRSFFLNCFWRPWRCTASIYAWSHAEVLLNKLNGRFSKSLSKYPLRTKSSGHEIAGKQSYYLGMAIHATYAQLASVAWYLTCQTRTTDTQVQIPALPWGLLGSLGQSVTQTHHKGFAKMQWQRRERGRPPRTLRNKGRIKHDRVIFTLPLYQNYRRAEKILALSSNSSIGEKEGTCSPLCTYAPLWKEQSNCYSMRKNKYVNSIKCIEETE